MSRSGHDPRAAPAAASAEDGTSPRFRFLLLDDSPADSELIERELRCAGLEFEARRASSRETFQAALDGFAPDLVLADYSMPSFSGPEALGMVRALSRDMPFVLVSGSVGEEAAIEIIKDGATDYVLKDRLVRLVPAVIRALEEAEQKSLRRAAEQALITRAAELERSNAELEQFAYLCSHDLREPLRMITTFVEVIEETGDGGLGEARAHLRHVVDGAKRMRRMVDGILEYSRVHSDQLEMTSCDSARALGVALENLAPLLRETRAVVTSGALPVVRASETQLERVFQNLVSNGIKFNHSRPPRIEVEAEHDGGVWVFAVRDNGIGVAPEFKDKAFKMFQRFHTRSQYPGEGIGLAVCRRVVERHGGRIWMDSNAHGGSVVLFTVSGESGPLPATHPGEAA